MLEIQCANLNQISIESLKKKAVSFLKWYYKKKEKGENGIPINSLVDGKDGDSTHPYRINYKSVNQYIKFLNTSKMLSSKYFDSLYEYFKRCDANFVKYHQYYYIPFGFDYDMVTKDMEDMEIDKSKIIKTIRKRESVIIEVIFGDATYPYTFEFSEYNGNWLIDKINGDFAKEISHKLPYNTPNPK